MADIKTMLAKALMDSPYLDTVHNDKHTYELAAEHLLENGSLKVTMCKDCQYAYYNSSNESLKCKYHAWDTFEVSDTDFCSRGRRVDNNG
jgi:hypothetical protein